MNPPPTTDRAAPHTRPLARCFRYLYRVPMLLWHLLVHLPVVLVLISPLFGPIRVGSQRLDHMMVRAWSAGLMRVFGFRLRAVGAPLPGGTMFVANHVSWIDIVALHSQQMMGLVAPAARWGYFPRGARGAAARWARSTPASSWRRSRPAR